MSEPKTLEEALDVIRELEAEAKANLETMIRELAESHHSRCTYGQTLHSCPDPLCRDAAKALSL